MKSDAQQNQTTSSVLTYSYQVNWASIKISTYYEHLDALRKPIFQ